MVSLHHWFHDVCPKEIKVKDPSRFTLIGTWVKV